MMICLSRNISSYYYFLISVRVKQHLFEIDFFNNNNVNVFAVTFDQFKFLILNLNKKNY